MKLQVAFGILAFLTNATLALMGSNEKYHYFTGRGCGTTTQIKFFDTMPADISGLTCAFVRKDKSLVGKSPDPGKKPPSNSEPSNNS